MQAPSDELLASRSHQTPSRRIALFVARALDSKASLLAGYFDTVYFAFVVFSIYLLFSFRRLKILRVPKMARQPNAFSVK